jgi:hypothetical protein
MESFMAFGLSRTEAEIATNGPVENHATTRDDLGEMFEPIGRGGF